MNTHLKALFAAVVLTSAAVAANADPHGFRSYSPAVVVPAPSVQGWHRAHGHPLAGLNEIRARQSEQIARIERGFHRGAITHREFRRLMAEQRDISALERAFVADGFLAPHERVELHRRLDFAAQHIHIESHDAQRRYW
jgi:hypothetical protein